jgi:hypothetical protein
MAVAPLQCLQVALEAGVYKPATSYLELNLTTAAA